jgi:hypothetical protein
MYDKILPKLLRYIGQTIIIYFLLRYYPYGALSVSSSMFISFIILLITILLELIFVLYLKNNQSALEPFEDANSNETCTTCNANNDTIKEDGYEGEDGENGEDEGEGEGENENNENKCELTCKVDSNKNVKNCRMKCNGTVQRVRVNTQQSCDANTRGPATEQSVVSSNPYERESLNKTIPSKIVSRKDLDTNTYQSVGSKSMQVNLGDDDETVLTSADNRNNVINRRRLNEQGDQDEGRVIDGPLDSDLPFTDYNHLPVAVGYDSRDYEYGYSYIPPEKWHPTPPRPPICVTDRRTPICPVMAGGDHINLKEFDSSRRITQPLQLNTNFVEKRLNKNDPY